MDPKPGRPPRPAPGDPADDWKLLLIVTPGMEQQYAYLKKAFEGRSWASVIMDRRGTVRRRGEAHGASDGKGGRRARDRRRFKDVDDDLLMRGWAHIWVRVSPPRA